MSSQRQMLICMLLSGLRRIPKLGGSDLDLHLLYVEVTSRGGLEQVPCSSVLYPIICLEGLYLYLYVICDAISALLSSSFSVNGGT
jgi:hypothetical protein